MICFGQWYSASFIDAVALLGSCTDLISDGLTVAVVVVVTRPLLPNELPAVYLPVRLRGDLEAHTTLLRPESAYVLAYVCGILCLLADVQIAIPYLD